MACKKDTESSKVPCLFSRSSSENGNEKPNRKKKRKKKANGREGGLDDTIGHGVLPDELAVVILSEVEALKSIQQSGEL